MCYHTFHFLCVCARVDIGQRNDVNTNCSTVDALLYLRSWSSLIWSTSLLHPRSATSSWCASDCVLLARLSHQCPLILIHLFICPVPCCSVVYLLTWAMSATKKKITWITQAPFLSLPLVLPCVSELLQSQYFLPSDAKLIYEVSAIRLRLLRFWILKPFAMSVFVALQCCWRGTVVNNPMCLSSSLLFHSVLFIILGNKPRCYARQVLYHCIKSPDNSMCFSFILYFTLTTLSRP